MNEYWVTTTTWGDIPINYVYKKETTEAKKDTITYLS